MGWSIFFLIIYYGLVCAFSVFFGYWAAHAYPRFVKSYDTCNKLPLPTLPQLTDVLALCDSYKVRNVMESYNDLFKNYIDYEHYVELRDKKNSANFSFLIPFIYFAVFFYFTSDKVALIVSIVIYFASFFVFRNVLKISTWEEIVIQTYKFETRYESVDEAIDQWNRIHSFSGHYFVENYKALEKLKEKSIEAKQVMLFFPLILYWVVFILPD